MIYSLIAVRSKNPWAVAFIRCFTKKGVEKIQEEHQQAIRSRDNQIPVLQFTNEAHQQEILRLNEEIDDLIVNRHIARLGCFDNVLCDVSTGCRKNISDGLNFVIQTWKWLTNVMIQSPFTDGKGSTVK